MNIYDFTAKDIDGNLVSLQDYKGKVLIVVNTASKCGFTPQYEDLQKLYDNYKDKGVEILGFPCNQFMDQEPGTNQETKSFCSLNYGVNFPLFEKTDVNGKFAHPLFKYLVSEMSNPTNKMLDAMLKDKFPEFAVGDAVKWNFTKFIIDKEGNVVNRFEPATEPMDMVSTIENLL